MSDERDVCSMCGVPKPAWSTEAYGNICTSCLKEVDIDKYTEARKIMDNLETNLRILGVDHHFED